MRISSVSLHATRLPLKQPFVVSYGSYTHIESVLVRITTESGLVGWGEAAPDPYVTGETWSSTFAMLRHDLLPLLKGMNALDRELIHSRLNSVVTGAPAAKAAIDIALWDLLGKRAQLPIYELLGGRVHENLMWHETLAIAEPRDMAKAARAALKAGFKEIKMKVGADSVADDVARIEAVREAVGDACSLSVDANQGWRDAATAITAINAIKSASPAWIEQAVTAHDYEALAEVRRATSMPQMADEAVHNAKDALRLIKMRGADLINVKLMKTGGITEGLRVISLCETAGLKCMLGSMLESVVATAAGVHIALARRDVVTNGLVGPSMLKEDIGSGLVYKDGRLDLENNSPGLSVDVDEAQLLKFTTDSTAVF